MLGVGQRKLVTLIRFLNVNYENS